MADERVMSIIEFIKNKYPNPDLSEFPDKFAVQIELTDIPGGVFYMEVLNGELSIGCKMIGPVSVPSSTKCTVAPVIFTPRESAPSCTFNP